MVMHAPWTRSFLVDDPESGLVSPNAAIRLSQIDLKEFQFESKLRYVGERTGLEGKVSESILADIRVVGPATLPVTDLASVPQPLRWLVAQYGSHTPAALIHDRLIGLETPINGLTEPHADRYFDLCFRISAFGGSEDGSCGRLSPCELGGRPVA